MRRRRLFQLSTLFAALFIAGCATTSPPTGVGADALRPAELAPRESGQFEQQLQWLELANPHTHPQTIDGQPRMVFDAASAESAGLPEAAIRFASEIADLALRVSFAPDRATGRAWLAAEPEILAFLEQYRTSWESGELVSRQLSAETCAGDQTTPFPCNPWNDVEWGAPDKERVTRRLLGTGWHETVSYATDVPGEDFTRGIEIARDRCGFSVIRYQAILTEYPSGWGYRFQKDVNPEVYSPPLMGNWPFTPGYDLYAYWWHTQFC